MSYVEEKSQTTYSSAPVPSPLTGNNSFADYEKRDHVYKRRIRILRFISRVISLILNAYMVISESYALAKYLLTKDHVIAGNVHPWATPTTLWPTLMLLAIAILTFLMNFITLCAYVCGVGAANKTSNFFSKLGYVMMAAHVIAWGVAMGLFKMANTGKDLWGFACGPESDAIQEQVQSFLNFGTLCTLQTGSWYSSIVETITYLITFVLTILVVKRAAHKKKMAKERERMSAHVGYVQGTQDVELGTSYPPGKGQRYMPVPAGSTNF